jgi:hypothetical protein
MEMAMNKINLLGRILDVYNRQTINSLMTSIQTEINSAADGYLFPVMPVTSAYTVSLNDAFVPVNATSGAITVTLPKVAECKGKMIVIKKTDASANAVTVDGNGSETIDGATTNALSSQYDSVSLMSDGTQWLIV